MKNKNDAFKLPRFQAYRNDPRVKDAYYSEKLELYYLDLGDMFLFQDGVEYGYDEIKRLKQSPDIKMVKIIHECKKEFDGARIIE